MKRIIWILKKRTRIAGLFLVLIFPLKIEAQEPVFPQYRGYVNDFAGIISPGDASKIESFAKELEDKTTAQLAVVTIKSAKPEVIETYAVKLFQKWGIGRKGRDNGVLLLVASEDRKVRIETGYGLEGAIPDVLADRIIEGTIIPYFKKGEYSKGIFFGSVSILALVAQEYKVELTGLGDVLRTALPEEGGNLSWTFFLIAFILTTGGLVFLCRHFALSEHSGYWYSGGGISSRGFGGGIGGGGFGGFGGGMSGGGGASGGW